VLLYAQIPAQLWQCVRELDSKNKLPEAAEMVYYREADVLACAVVHEESQTVVDNSTEGRWSVQTHQPVGSKRTRGGETDMDGALAVSAKMQRFTKGVEKDVQVKDRVHEEIESGSSNAHNQVQDQEQQDGVCEKRPRTCAAAHEESQAALDTDAGGTKGCADADGTARTAESSPAEDLEMRLCVVDRDGRETEVVARLRADTVDLSVHIGLVALPEALRGLTAMRELTVRSRALKTLPMWLGELVGLEMLLVGGTYDGLCLLKALPESLGLLTLLTTLDVRFCGALGALPESLGALTRLTTLDLGYCTALTALPELLGALTGLEELNLKMCKSLTALPTSFGSLTGLTLLDLGYCSCMAFTALPASFGALTRLTTLDLSFCKSIMVLPASLGALTALKTLGLYNCDALHTPPPSIVLDGTRAVLKFLLHSIAMHLHVLDGQKEKMVVMHVHADVDVVNLSAHAGLVALPEELRGLTAMRELTVASRALKMLPESLVSLTRLMKLDLLLYKSFTVLPETLGSLTGLTSLNLSYCMALMVLPASLGSLTGLEMLGLDCCEALTALPDSLGALTRLTTLDLSRCKSIMVLPASLGALTALKTLGLYNCDALHTPPPSIVLDGTRAVLKFLLHSIVMHLRVLDGQNEKMVVMQVHADVDVVNLSAHAGLVALPEELRGLTAMRELTVASRALKMLPEWLGELHGLKVLRVEGRNFDEQCPLQALPETLGSLTGLKSLYLQRCGALAALPASLGALTGLTTLDLQECMALTALPASLGELTGLTTLKLHACDALHTPPPSILRAGTGAVLQFLSDLAKGEAPSHLIKVVLLGDQRAGKSSLADSLVRGGPAMRADNDRTVGIEVRRWRLGEPSQVVANIYDVAGHRVYRATHGFFMSPSALFLHVVRCDLPEEKAVTVLLEWVEAVQQEAPGAVMGVVWTHIDNDPTRSVDVDGSRNGQPVTVCVQDGNIETWTEMMLCLKQSRPQSMLKNKEIVMIGNETEDVRDKIAFMNLYTEKYFKIPKIVKEKILDLQRRGSVGILLTIECQCYNDADVLCWLSTSLSRMAEMPIILMKDNPAFVQSIGNGIPSGANMTLTVFPGAWMPFNCMLWCLCPLRT